MLQNCHSSPRLTPARGVGIGDPNVVDISISLTNTRVPRMDALRGKCLESVSASSINSMAVQVRMCNLIKKEGKKCHKSSNLGNFLPN